MILEMACFPAKTEILKYRAYISEHLTYFLLFDLILPGCSLAAVFARTNTFHITSIEGGEWRKKIILFFLSAESSCSIVNVSGFSSEY